MEIQRLKSTKGLLKKAALYVIDDRVEFNQVETESLLRLAREMIVLETELPPKYPISDTQRLPENLALLGLEPMEENNSQLANIQLTL